MWMAVGHMSRKQNRGKEYCTWKCFADHTHLIQSVMACTGLSLLASISYCYTLLSRM